MLVYIVASFACGLLSSIGIIGALAFYLYKTYYEKSIQSKRPPAVKEYCEFSLPESLVKKVNSKENGDSSAEALAVNLFLQFLFQERKDTDAVRRFFLIRANKELKELREKNKQVSRVVTRIAAHDVGLGSSLPVITDLRVVNCSYDQERSVLKQLEISVVLDYEGGFYINVDVGLIFNKSAAVYVHVQKLAGTARLLFKAEPKASWSFSFYEEPTLVLDVSSSFNGRPMATLANLIANQIRRSVRKKHTLPNYKIRYNPFFVQNPSASRLAAPSELKTFIEKRSTSTRLRVTLVRADRVSFVAPNESEIYCSLALSDSSVSSETTCVRKFTLVDVIINRTVGESIGAIFEEKVVDGRNAVVFRSVFLGSPASRSHLKKGDILLCVNTQPVNTAVKATALIRKGGEMLNLKIKRPDVPEKEDSTPDVSYDETQDDNPDGYVTIDLRTSKVNKDSPEATTQESELRKGETPPMRPRSRSVTRMDMNSDQQHSGTSATSKSTLHSSTEIHPTGDISPTLARKSRSASDQMAEKPLLQTTQKPKIHVESSSKPLSAVVTWSETFEFNIKPKHTHLNINCYIRTSDGTSKIVGRASVPIEDIILDCFLTDQRDSQKVVDITPTPVTTPSKDARGKKETVLQPTETPSAGRLVLQFQHASELTAAELKSDTAHTLTALEKEIAERKPDPNTQYNVIEKMNAENANLHSFVDTGFSRSVYCNFCSKKIWMKTASQCMRCGMISHQKCKDRCNEMSACDPGQWAQHTQGTPDSPSEMKNPMSTVKTLLQPLKDLRKRRAQQQTDENRPAQAAAAADNNCSFST